MAGLRFSHLYCPTIQSVYSIDFSFFAFIVMLRKVVALHLFPGFESLFEQFPEERVSDVYQYYTKEAEQKFGVVAIELQ